MAVVDRTTEGFATRTTRVRVCETGAGNLVQEFDGLGTIHDMALSSDGQRLALAGQQGTRLLSALDGSLIAEFGNHAREVMSVAFSPDGATLALGSLDGTVSLWAVPVGRFLWQTQAWIPMPAYGEAWEIGIWDLAFSPNGQTLFALGQTPTVDTSARVSALQVSNGQELFSVYGTNEYSRPGLSPDGSRVVFGGYEDGQAQVWSVTENRLVFELEGHMGMVLAARFSPDGEQIATAAMDGSVRLWQAEDGSPLATLTGHTGPVRAIQFSPDGAQLASIGDDAVLRIWDASDRRLLKSIETQTGEWLANSIAFSPDGKSVLLAYGCPYVEVCPAHGAGDLRRVHLESGGIETLIVYPIYSIQFTPDQSAFALEGAQRPQSGRVNGGQYQIQSTYTSPMGNGALGGAAITPDGELFFSGNRFGLHVWKAASGEMLALCKGSRSPYGDMWVTPDQKMIVISQSDGLVSLWGVPTGQ